MPKTDKDKSKNTYEAMFLIGPVADQDQVLNLPRGMIEHHGGEIIVLKKWDERKLAYEIEGQKRGTYVIAFFKAPGGAVTAIERDVNLSEDVLRVIVLRADHLNKEEMEAVTPQPIQPREERPSWDRPEGDRPRRDDRGDRGPRDDRGPREDRAPRGRREEEAGAAKE